MFKRLNAILLLFCLMAISMGFQCGKDTVEPPKHRFVEKVSLTPAKKSYNVNDTIWLKYLNIDKTFLDTISGQRLSANTIKFLFGATLSPKYNTPINPTDGFCSFILPSNTIQRYITNQSGTGTSFIIDCDNSSLFNIQLGIVLKHPGTYVLDLPDGIELQACASQTNPYPSERLQFFYNLLDCNKDVYLSIPESARQEFPNGLTESRITSKVAFAFKVQ